MTTAAPIARDATPAARVRLDYLHGLRGLAALLVAVGHCLQLADTQTGHVITWLRPLDYLSSLAVPTFIVLSGYCLALPVVRYGHLPGGARGFMRRRAGRILPAYYLALGLSLLAGLCLTHTASSQDVLHPGPALLGPLLLLHDLWGATPLWNRPLWSLPIEWHIYFLAPLLFGAWRRYGVGRATALALLVVGLALWPVAWLHLDRLWLPFYALFALGAATAALVAALPRWPPALRAPRVLAALTVLGGGAWAASFASGSYATYVGRLPWAFSAWGVWVCLLLAYLGARGGAVRAALGAGPPRALGELSYSLYLVHWVPVSVFALATSRLGAPVSTSPTLSFALIAAGAIPCSLLLARLSYHVAERPFLRPTGRAAATDSSVRAPAPARLPPRACPLLRAAGSATQSVPGRPSRAR